MGSVNFPPLLSTGELFSINYNYGYDFFEVFYLGVSVVAAWREGGSAVCWRLPREPCWCRAGPGLVAARAGLRRGAASTAPLPRLTAGPSPAAECKVQVIHMKKILPDDLP